MKVNMNKKKKKKKVQPLCKNCRLFNKNTGKCGVAILNQGEQIHIDVSPEDTCFFEGTFVAWKPTDDPTTRVKDVFKPLVEQVRWWTEDPATGKPAKNGKVKIEYPEGFFGTDNNHMLD